jgi:hypothetical protein
MGSVLTVLFRMEIGCIFAFSLIFKLHWQCEPILSWTFATSGPSKWNRRLWIVPIVFNYPRNHGCIPSFTCLCCEMRPHQGLFSKKYKRSTTFRLISRCRNKFFRLAKCSVAARLFGRS